MNQGSFVIAHHHPLERAELEDAEYLDGQFLISTQRKSGGVHHLKIFSNDFVKGANVL